MRFEWLHLLAFGPFSDLKLELGAGAPGGLHVIYGENEAGKSTALRAVLNLLFGIPERTEDAHRHPSSELKLAAELRRGETRLSVLRRKKRRDSLRDLKDNPLDEEHLRKFLNGADLTLFQNLFGLDHQRLKQGGQALLEGRGDIGESLFDAGTGGRGVHALLKRLEKQADELYKPRSSKAKLNQAISAWKQLKKDCQDAIQPPQKWVEQKGALEAKLLERSELEQRRRALREEQHQLHRIREALPVLARHAELKQRRAALGEVPQISEDAKRRREQALDSLRQAEWELGELARAEQRLVQRRQGVVWDEALLDLPSDRVARLRDRVGSHRQAARDLPKRRAELRTKTAEAQRWLERLGIKGALGEFEQKRLNSVALKRLKQLTQRQQSVCERLRQAEQRAHKAEQRYQIEHQRWQGLQEPPGLSVLQRELTAHAAHGKLEARQAELEEQYEARLSRAARALASLEFTVELPKPEGLAAFVFGLRVPSLESIDTYGAKFEALARANDELRRDERIVIERREQALARLEAMRLEGAPPSEQELERARRARHSAWGPLKAALTSNDAKSLDQSQIEQFERELASADEIADRLRREATRVAELAGLKASVYECERALERLDQVRESLKLQQTALERDWVDTWVQVPVRLEPPAAMRSFRLRYDEVRRTFEELEQLATERARGLRELETARSAMIAALRAAKVTIPETERLSVLLARAAQALSEGQALLRERQRLQAVLDEQNVRRVQEREALAEAEQELEAWRQDWEQALARAPLLDTKDPEQVEPVLDGLVELYARVDELRQLKSRIQAMEQDAREFEAEVQALVSAHAPELEARTVDDAAEELERRYREAERGRELLRQIDSELEQNERRGESVSATRRKAELELSVLCQVGGVDAPEELEAVEQRVESARRLEQDLASAEQELWSLASGLSLDALVSEAAGKERQHVAARLQEIEDELNEVEEKLQDVRVDAVRLERGLERYGDERAVELREQLESSTAEARSYLESYARIKLALVILEREVTAYRERHQGPVLARADGLFRELTLGRYQGLRVGLEENVLRCVRHDGAELEFESLSEGTQYQLYLALRIATIERYAESSGPLPLVLDDLLIHFDDERARAAFQVLGQLAERMQVLYFTHLSRDIELAEAASARQLCTVHCLPVPERQPRA